MLAPMKSKKGTPNRLDSGGLHLVAIAFLAFVCGVAFFVAYQYSEIRSLRKEVDALKIHVTILEQRLPG